MDKPLVSVIIPTYNIERYIEEALQSILNQTYKNIEVVVVDDCSTDNTLKILEDIQKTDHRIKVYKNNQNLKISKTLNKAITYSSGKYIARMDGDDISLPLRLEKQVNFLEQNDEYGLCGTHLIKIDEDGNEIGIDKKILDFDIILNTIELASPLAHPTWLVRKEVYQKLDGYRGDCPAQDYDFLLRCITSNIKFINIDYIGLKLRERIGNTSSKNGLFQRKVVNYFLKLYKQRKETNADDFSDIDIGNLKESNKILIQLHSLSQKYFEKSAYNKNKDKYLKSILYLILSLLLSPYQIQFFVRWIKLKRFLKSVN